MLLFHNHNYNKLFLHGILVLIFSGLYYLTQLSNIDNKLSLYDCFYFSLVTESTIGYGHIVPNNNLMKNISVIQIILIFCLLFY